MPSHARVGDHGIVHGGPRSAHYDDAAYDLRVGHIPIIVRIRIDDDHIVRELARDVGVIPATLFRAEIDAVTPGAARRTLTSSSVAVSMMVIVPVNVAAVMTNFPLGLTGV